jgi:hypothetical protein
MTMLVDDFNVVDDSNIDYSVDWGKRVKCSKSKMQKLLKMHVARQTPLRKNPNSSQRMLS